MKSVCCPRAAEEFIDSLQVQLAYKVCDFARANY